MKQKRNQPERKLQLAICEYLKLQYPDLIFGSEGSGIKMTMGQAILAKRMRSEDKLPDLFVAESRGGYCGLFIELKVESVFLKDGSLSTQAHIKEQAATLDRLSHNGYYAVFGCGIDGAKAIVDTYMKLPLYNQGKPEASLVDDWYKK